MKIYALRHIETQRIMSLEVTGNGDAEFCGTYQAALDLPSQFDTQYTPWTTTNYGIATNVAETDVPWYNSCMDCPMNKYVGQLEVVELTA